MKFARIVALFLALMSASVADVRIDALRKDAEKGDATAQCDLGYAYRKGVGVQQDYAQAVKWYRKAAEQGLAEAQVTLGYAYN